MASSIRSGVVSYVSPKSNRIFRAGSAVTFSTTLSVNLWLGIVTIRPANVLMRVERMPTSTTVPSTPSISTRSPTTKGLSTKIVMPPKMLATKSFAARPMAKPPMPTPARSAPTSYPALFIAMMTPSTQTVERRVLRRIGAICAIIADSDCSPVRVNRLPSRLSSRRAAIHVTSMATAMENTCSMKVSTSSPKYRWS